MSGGDIPTARPAIRELGTYRGLVIMADAGGLDAVDIAAELAERAAGVEERTAALAGWLNELIKAAR